MSKRLTETDKLIVVGKIQGKRNKDIALQVYPNQKQTSAQVEISKALKKPSIQMALAKALARHDITIDRTLLPISKALHAKTVKQERTGEVVTDNGDGSKSVEYIYKDTEEDNLPLQLQASDRASKLLGLINNDKDNNHDNRMTVEDMQVLASTSDEVELTKVLFKRKD